MPAARPAARRLAVPLLIALAAAGGCRSNYEREYAPAPNAPADYDEAMALRDSPRTTGYYASGDVAAGPLGFPYRYAAPLPGSPNYGQRRYLAVLADPGVFVANLVLLPANLIANPPTEDRVYQGVIVEPTYTAAVPLPPAPEQRAATGRVAAKPATPPATSRAATLPQTLPATRPTSRRLQK